MVSHPVAITDRRYEKDRFSFSGDELSNFPSASFLQYYFLGFAKLGSGVGRLDFISFLGIRWFSQSLRYASTAAAGQPEFGSGNDSNKQHVAKQVKEALPEECDEAVEDLSEVKAKAKQLQEFQKSAQSVLRRVWAMLLGVGAALRVVASMSRLKIYSATLLVRAKSSCHLFSGPGQEVSSLEG